MVEKYLPATEPELIAVRPIGCDLNFSLIKQISFEAKDIKLCVITGEIGIRHNFNKCNIVASKFRHASSYQADFTNVDFKDCIFTECSLTDSKFSDGAISSTFFSGGKIDGCSFRDMAITETEFRHVEFRNCDFSKLLIKSCRFFECTFVDCITSNKLLESSLVLGCRFVGTILEIGTIASNFGIVANQVDAELRGLPTPTPDEMDNRGQYIGRIASESRLSAVDVFRVLYYFDAENALMSDEFDICLSVSAWEELIWMPSSFISTFNDFVDFLLHLFDNDKLLVFSLWRLQTVAAELAGRLEHEDREISALLLRPLLGIQTTLARLLEDQVALQSELCELYAKELTLLVNGPLDRSFYLAELAHWFDNSTTEITRLVPHNSPAELTLVAKAIGDLAPFIALLVCTRVSLEIQKLRFETNKSLTTRSRKSETDNTRRVQAEPGDLSAFALSVGLTKDRKAYELKLMTMLPGDHFLRFMVQLRLDVTVRTISRARSILHGILGRDI